MLKSKPKIIVVCGPTASGKSDAAIKLAKQFNGEVISADSRQIFRGMDIGSGKVIRDKIQDTRYKIQKNAYFSDGVVHHLIDVANPMEDFNVSHFKATAEKAIDDIVKRGKLPVICGGTGFWIDSLINDTALPDVKPDEQLRGMLCNKSAEELFEQLEKLDPERAKNIDKKNKVRLIRAIEICKAIGKVPPLLCHPELVSGSSGMLKQVQHDSNYDFLQIGIDVPREMLDAKIKKRLDERLENGMIGEVENLHKNGVSWEWMEKIGLEYRWISRYLQKKIHFEDMKEKLYFDIIHYAKRQMTWLKRNKHILWLHEYDDIQKSVRAFLEKNIR